MAENVEWTPEAWSAAVEALRSGGSVSELLALYDGGTVTSQEVLGAVWEYCYDKPTVAAGLAEVFRQHPDEYVRWAIGKGLEELLRARSGGSN